MATVTLESKIAALWLFTDGLCNKDEPWGIGMAMFILKYKNMLECFGFSTNNPVWYVSRW